MATGRFSVFCFGELLFAFLGWITVGRVMFGVVLTVFGRSQLDLDLDWDLDGLRHSMAFGA
jgi:hypothetical protein